MIPKRIGNYLWFFFFAFQTAISHKKIRKIKYFYSYLLSFADDDTTHNFELFAANKLGYGKSAKKEFTTPKRGKNNRTTKLRENKTCFRITCVYQSQKIAVCESMWGDFKLMNLTLNQSVRQYITPNMVYTDSYAGIPFEGIDEINKTCPTLELCFIQCTFLYNRTTFLKW